MYFDTNPIYNLTQTKQTPATTKEATNAQQLYFTLQNRQQTTDTQQVIQQVKLNIFILYSQQV